MCNDIYVDMLEKREIRPTSMRILILKIMLEKEEMLSMTDIENILESVDKSTISRTLNLFLEKHLAHTIDDGSGSLKYGVCHRECTCSVEDQHSHFFCEKCQKTYCMTSLPAPKVILPKGFALNGINYVMKGLCPLCTNNKKRD